MRILPRHPLSILLPCLLGACASLPPPPPETVAVTILGINDFHGQIQSAGPVPKTLQLPDPAHPGSQRNVPAGGAAYLASALAELRAANPDSITVGVGDLIGAAPLVSTLLADEPAIEVLNRLGVSLSTVGNHEFDHGRDELLRRIRGECPADGCKLPGFSGAHFDYLAANIIDEATGKPWLKPYVIRQLGSVRVAFVGADLRGVPDIVMASGVRGLYFEDEAIAINRVIPEIRAQGVETIVALIHQGADYHAASGAVSEPDYACPGFAGPIVDIVKHLDKSVGVVMSAHTHEAYTCKVDGRLVTQAGSYGALVSEIRLRIDRHSGALIDASATNHVVDQQGFQPDAAMQAYVADVSASSKTISQQRIGQLPATLERYAAEQSGKGDSALGNLIADGMLDFARQAGAADMAFMNSGGLRANLPSGPVTTSPQDITLGDLYAVQPFGNDVVVLSLSGAQILAMLNQQTQQGNKPPHLLQVSRGLSYRWNPAAPAGARASDVRLDGEPLQPQRNYRVVTNSFIAEGGDGLRSFTAGTERQTIGPDIDATRRYLTERSRPLPAYSSEGRIRLE